MTKFAPLTFIILVAAGACGDLCAFGLGLLRRPGVLAPQIQSFIGQVSILPLPLIAFAIAFTVCLHLTLRDEIQSTRSDVMASIIIISCLGVIIPFMSRFVGPFLAALRIAPDLFVPAFITFMIGLIFQVGLHFEMGLLGLFGAAALGAGVSFATRYHLPVPAGMLYHTALGVYFGLIGALRQASHTYYRAKFQTPR